MLTNKRVWILESEGLPHDVEILLYRAEKLEVRQSGKDSFADDFLNFGKKADAIVVGVDFQFPRETIEQLENCKIICSFGMGFDQIDLEAAAKKGIYVTHIPSYCHTEVADHTIALSLTLLRRLFTYNQQVKSGQWQPTHVTPIQRLSDTTIGLLGFGQIARMVAERFRPFGVRLIAHDKYVSEEAFTQHGVTAVSLDELLAQSHLLSLHVPLTKETKHLINERTLSQMKKDSLIVNTCRGEVIDESALAQAITSGHILGAGLDVLNEEPPEADHELLKLEEVIITPHAAYYSQQAEEQMQKETAANVITCLKGQEPSNIVNSVANLS